jgi:hypothetical protein
MIYRAEASVYNFYLFGSLSSRHTYIQNREEVIPTLHGTKVQLRPLATLSLPQTVVALPVPQYAVPCKATRKLQWRFLQQG